MAESQQFHEENRHNISLIYKHFLFLSKYIFEIMIYIQVYVHLFFHET